MRRSLSLLPRTHPLVTFATVLGVVFVAEAAVMFVLPHILRLDVSRVVEAVVDASLLTLVAGPFLWWLIVRPLSRLAELRSRMLEQILAAQEVERRRLARELHDGIGQLLTSLLVVLRASEDSGPPKAPDSGAGTTAVRSIATTIYEELRRISAGLRPAALDDLGLQAALRGLVESFQTTQHITANITFQPEHLDRLAEKVEISLYRIVQEALTNVARHSGATNADIRLELKPDGIRLTISDDGRGFDPGQHADSRSASSLGISSMRERAALLGGHLILHSTPGKGTTVDVHIPQ